MSGRPMSSTSASGTVASTSLSAAAPPSARRTSYPASSSARRSTSRRARSSSTTSSRITCILLAVSPPRERLRPLPTVLLCLLCGRFGALPERGGEDPVDEPGCIGAAELLGGLDGLVDRALGRDRPLAGDGVRIGQL